jgi:hypothetical protein
MEEGREGRGEREGERRERDRLRPTLFSADGALKI